MAVKVDGLRQTVRSLERMGVAVSDLKAAFKRIGSLVVTDAQRLAPVRTGRLAGSLRASNTKNKAIVRAGSARVPYAGVIHYGWPARNIEAQPFLTTAVERNERTSVEIMDKELKALINRYGLDN